jgi:hypothetical protein
MPPSAADAHASVFGRATTGDREKSMRARSVFIVTLLAAFGAADGAADNVVVYLSDQNLDAVLRIQDLNGDGDTLDAGEVIVFVDKDPAETGIENTQRGRAATKGEQ